MVVSFLYLLMTDLHNISETPLDNIDESRLFFDESRQHTP